LTLYWHRWWLLFDR